MEKKDIVIALVEKYANGKNAQFAKLLGVSPQTISAWISRNTLDYDLIFTKCRGLNPMWLLTGEGEMFIKEGEKKIPLYDDVDTIGGNNGVVANVDIPLDVIGRAMGHSWVTKTVTSVYIDFDRRKVDDANRRVIDAIGER